MRLSRPSRQLRSLLVQAWQLLAWNGLWHEGCDKEMKKIKHWKHTWLRGDAVEISRLDSTVSGCTTFSVSGTIQEGNV